MAGAKKPAAKAAPRPNPKNNDPALIRSVAKKITTDPKFAGDANMMMSANAVITRAKKAGKTPEQIAAMSAAQLRKLI